MNLWLKTERYESDKIKPFTVAWKGNSYIPHTAEEQRSHARTPSCMRDQSSPYANETGLFLTYKCTTTYLISRAVVINTH